MSIILILILLFIGLPMVGTLIMTMFGIAIWILKMLWGWFFGDGFVGHGGQQHPRAAYQAADGFADFGSSSSSAAATTTPSNSTNGLLLGVFSEPSAALCADPGNLTSGQLTDLIKSLGGFAQNCEQYKDNARGGYVVNMCHLSDMYINSVAPLLGSTVTEDEATKNLDAARNLTAKFCEVRPDPATDLYADIVQKFNDYETTMNTYLTKVSLAYKYRVPDVLSKEDYKGAVLARYNSAYPSVAVPKSYGCVTFDEAEQGIIKTLKRRIFGTPTERDAIAAAVTANLCAAKGWGNGAEATSYKGCGTGCLGCCRPSAEELAPAGAVTGTGAVGATGVAATGAAIGAGEAKCPQPVLREYVLKRKPAQFKKVPSPTAALFECFEDGAADLGERQLDVRETARVAKAVKLQTLLV